RAKFNQDDYKPTTDEITRFPSRPKHELPENDHSKDLTPSMPSLQARRSNVSKSKPPGYWK
ncbi:TPA: molybdopterin-guanine dinucleotide biosynthesis protein MobA, partial [Escherichia coli]